MQKIINTLRYFFKRFLVTTLGILVVLYVMCFTLDFLLNYKGYPLDNIGVKPLLFYFYHLTLLLIFFSSIEAIILLVVYGVLWPITQKLMFASVLQPILAFVVIALFLINCAIAYSIPKPVAGVVCNGTTYLITEYFNDRTYYTIDIRRGLFDVKTDFLGYNNFYSSSQLTCDKNANLVRLFTTGEILLETYGSQQRVYDYMERVDDASRYIIYILYSYEEDNLTKYIVTACQNDKPDTCQFIPVSYTTLNQEDGNLKMTNDKLEVFIGEKVIFTYSIPSQP